MRYVNSRTADIESVMADIKKAMNNTTDRRNYIDKCTFCTQSAVKVKTDCATSYFYTKDIDTISVYEYDTIYEVVIMTNGTHNSYTFVKDEITTTKKEVE